MREIKVKSVVPIYLIGFSWILYVLVFPIYRWYDFVIASAVAFFVYKVSSKLIPSKTILVEEEPQPINTGNSELDDVLTTGTAYMSELNTLNLAISNTKINKQVDEMMRISKQIFAFVTRNPKKTRQIRQFMNYYLPTTINLLKNYDEFIRQGSKGENITAAIKKIEGVLDTAIHAFSKVLDDLFMDKVLDTSVDIEVFEKMIKDEGF